jgi:hypothetical protein
MTQATVDLESLDSLGRGIRDLLPVSHTANSAASEWASTSW